MLNCSRNKDAQCSIVAEHGNTCEIYVNKETKIMLKVLSLKYFGSPEVTLLQVLTIFGEIVLKDLQFLICDSEEV